MPDTVAPASPARAGLAAPSVWLLAWEARAVLEFAAGAAFHKPLQRVAPGGDGHAVMVLPGLGGSDLSTGLLRGFLRDLGYAALPWGMGTNRGLRPGIAHALQERLATLHARSGRKVSLIGQSLGGTFARELAKLQPRLVRQVITLGSPFTGDLRANNASRLYEWLSGESANAAPSQTSRLRVKPPLPTTSIYSKLDGVVSWRCSLETGQPEGQSIHLHGASHLGMAASPAALYLIAHRLAEPEAGWKPFAPTGWQHFFYGIDAVQAHAFNARKPSPQH